MFFSTLCTYFRCVKFANNIQSTIIIGNVCQTIANVLCKLFKIEKLVQSQRQSFMQQCFAVTKNPGKPLGKFDKAVQCLQGLLLWNDDFFQIERQIKKKLWNLNLWQKKVHCILPQVQASVVNVHLHGPSNCLFHLLCDVLFPFRSIGRLGSVKVKYLRRIGVQSR